MLSHFYNPVVGSEQGGWQPVLIVSNDIGNRHSPTVIILPITSRVQTKAKLPTYTEVNNVEGLDKNSLILAGQIRTIDKRRLEVFMNCNDVPIWEKYTLTIEEAAKYFRIGEKKLRQLAEENPTANWLIMNRNRVQIKRKQFEKIIDSMEAI